MAVEAALLVAAAAILSVALAAIISRILVVKAVAPDRPNGRSSHDKVASRAGGVAIAAGFFASVAMFWTFDVELGASSGYAALLGCGFAAFAFGGLDDFRPIGARLKLAAQIVIAVAFVALVGAVDVIPLPGIGEVDLRMAAFPLTVFWIVAFMNAYNFMDGVNGIAGVCAIYVLSAIAVAAAAGGGGEIGVPAVLLACAVFGFLPLNLPRGRIFMGDGGSQFIGFMVAAFAVMICNAPGDATSPMFTPVAFMPFLFDVFFTLAHRARRKRNLFEAHNEHVYQLLARLGRPHQSVAAIYLVLTIVSTTVAMLTNALDPRLQFVPALLLIAAFAPMALAVYRRAEAAGLLAVKPPRRAAAAPRAYAAAAE